MSSVSLPPATFSWPVQFNKPITLQSDGTASVPLTIRGGNGDPLKALTQWIDALQAPIANVGNAGGIAVFGDNITTFPGGDVFNPNFRTGGGGNLNLSSNSGGMIIGHGSGAFGVYYGIGAPSAVIPVTTGIPPNGSIYCRFDGGVGTTIYQVRAAAWAGIL